MLISQKINVAFFWVVHQSQCKLVPFARKGNTFENVDISAFIKAAWNIWNNKHHSPETAEYTTFYQNWSNLKICQNIPVIINTDLVGPGNIKSWYSYISRMFAF